MHCNEANRTFLARVKKSPILKILIVNNKPGWSWR